MSSQLVEEELDASELVAHRTPIPTQIVFSDEFYPDPQNDQTWGPKPITNASR